MIILPKFHAVFVSQSRCCTATMYEALTANYGGQRLGKNAHDNHVPPDYRRWFTFAISRNPYDRAVSYWQWMRQPRYRLADRLGSLTLGAFCRWLATTGTDPKAQTHGGAAAPLSQTEWLEPVPVSMVLPFERFPECLTWLPFWRGTGVPHRHKTEHRPWRELVKPRTRIARDIAIWAGHDFEKYGYERV